MQQYKFQLVPLPYEYSALEPYIDTRTMRIHHDRHLQTYVNNLNNVLEKYPQYQSWQLEKLICNYQWLPVEIRETVKNNAGGVYNHQFFFSHLSGQGSNMPYGQVAEKINKYFGDYDKFKEEFKKSALSVFGSGYTWLVETADGELKIITTQNQDVPICWGYSPIVSIDVWEHAYYLKHQNRRDKYIDDWFNVVIFN